MKTLSYILLSLLFVLSLFAVSGCAGQWQTATELRRERTRARIANEQAMYDDTEKALMIDKPSRLTDLKVR
jgi:hypothetical protein